MILNTILFLGGVSHDVVIPDMGVFSELIDNLRDNSVTTRPNDKGCQPLSQGSRLSVWMAKKFGQSLNWRVVEFSAQAFDYCGVDDRHRKRMLSETIRDRYEWTALNCVFYLASIPGIAGNIPFLYRLLFNHYEPLGSSSCGFGGDYPGSGSALRNSPAPHLITAWSGRSVNQTVR